MTSQEARDLGVTSGIEDVENVLAEQGLDAVKATLAPGHLGWDEAAINAAAHTFDGVPEEHREAYYEAYASAARQHAEELCEWEQAESYQRKVDAEEKGHRPHDH